MLPKKTANDARNELLVSTFLQNTPELWSEAELKKKKKVEFSPSNDTRDTKRCYSNKLCGRQTKEPNG